jgi:two-component system, LytTR family, response regulator
MKTRSLLVDDEQKLRKSLLHKLENNFPEIEVVGEAETASEAFEAIVNLKPDLVFLDIAMPRETGFDLLKKFRDIDFEVIFVTGYDSFAIEAIHFCAIGYVMKPAEIDALRLAIDNVTKRMHGKQNKQRFEELLSNVAKPNSQENKIGLPTADGLDFVKVEDILRCEGTDKYTRVHVKNDKHILCSYNIGMFKKMLEPYDFYLSHKSHLINMHHLIKYHKEGTIEMVDGAIVPVSIRKRTEFMDKIQRL